MLITLQLNVVLLLFHEMGHIPALVFLSAVSTICKMSCIKCKNSKDNTTFQSQVQVTGNIVSCSAIILQ